MNRLLLFTLALAACTLPALAQDITGTLQVHGFATQSLLYSHHNNFVEAHASDGDPGWSEAVVNITDNPTPKLRVGIQLHYLNLGDIGGAVPTVDWALGDYKFNDHIGIRAGKVKTPLGLFNDTQDIDAVYLWSLLPVSEYPIDNRSFFLSHRGGEVYGRLDLPAKAGKLQYRAWGGENSLNLDGGYVEQIKEGTGLSPTDPPAGPTWGADLRYLTPWRPLMVGMSSFTQHIHDVAPTGSFDIRVTIPAVYAQFDNGKLYFAGEYRTQPNHIHYTLGPYMLNQVESRPQWYAMAAGHVTPRLQVGTYYNHMEENLYPGMGRINSSKDWVQSVRFDCNANFYLKAENHFLHGTAIGFYGDDNTDLRPRTEIVVAKIGFAF